MNTSPSLQSQERVAGVLAYILFFIPMLMGVKTEFTMFHAKQSFLLMVISILSFFIPFFGGILGFVVFVVSLWCMYQTYLGNKFLIPYIANNMDIVYSKIGILSFFSVK